MRKYFKILSFLFLILSGNLSFANAANNETRSQIYSQFVEIKNEIGEDPKNFIPILGEVLLTVGTGNTSNEWQEINSDQTDSGRKSHVLTRGTGNAIITAMTITTLVKNLPEIGEKLAENIKKVAKELKDIPVKYRVSIIDKVKILAKDENLPQWIKESFLDRYYYTAEALDNITVFRRFGGEGANQAKLFGDFTSTEAVLGRGELAILPKWSNMQFEAELIVDKGTKLNLGKTAPQGKYTGGADQVLLPLGYPENWVKNIKDLKTGTIYTVEEFKNTFSELIGK